MRLPAGQCPLRSPALLLALVALWPGLQAAETHVVPPMQCIAATVDDVLRPLDDPWRNEALNDLYGRQDWRPAWLDQARGHDTLRPLIELLQTAGEHGLDPDDYHLSEIRRCIGAERPEHRARLDVLLTDALLRYSRDLRTGISELDRHDRQWHYDPPAFDAVGFVEELATVPDPVTELAALAPPHAGYRHLARALHDLERRRDQGERWPQLPAGPLLRAGDHHPQIELLRRRLAAEGVEQVPAPQADPRALDPPLAETLAQAQRRFGLAADGVLGPATRRALNRTLDERIEQVRLNLDRWRWLPRNPGKRYILVNLARFRMDLIEDGVSVMTQKVIVGQPYLSTPAFAGEMSYLVFNPYWEIPPNLGRRSVVPKQLEDPAYFRDKGIEVLTGWDDPETLSLDQVDLAGHQRRERHYRLRQAPGPENALGKVKFMFPNRFNVYLHDTPERELFDQDVRAFSSGCVRIERPLELAEYILGRQGWNSDQVRQRFEKANDYTVSLDEPLPVYLGYWTTWVEDDGRLVFTEDLYQRDEQLLAARHSRLPEAVPTAGPGSD
ncbi:MAG: L,D-transpeptidase family protein [Wenzhouxiangella sp.]